MRRCALPAPLDREKISLSSETRRYLCQVLRLTAGTRFIGFDGAGFERIFELAQEDGEHIALGIEQVYQGTKGAPIGLIFAVPKGDKLDQVARQITELGVSTLHLYSAERSVGIWKADKIKNKLARVERVSSEAARQSGRADQLAIFPPKALKELLFLYQDVPLKLYFDPEASHGWPQNIDAHIAQPQDSQSLSCVMIIGPEGGLSPTEIDLLKEAQWTGVRLQSPILRTENAAVVACALALDRLGYLA